MPYTKATLPSYVKKMPAKLKDAWMKAFNAAYKQYKGNEQKAFSTANSMIAKMGYQKTEEGEYMKITEALVNSFEEIREKVRYAIEAMPEFKKDVNGNELYVYIRDISPGKVVVKYGEYLYAMSYSIMDDTVIITEPKKVEEQYVLTESKGQKQSLKESVEIIKEGKGGENIDIDYISLKESSYNEDTGEIDVILVEAGTNELKRRHYPVSTIMEAAPLFKGLKMYINHPTKEEEQIRPERNLKDWVSTITESWGDDGKAKAKVSVHDTWLKERLKDKTFRENVGLSINTSGKLSMGRINGKDMQIVEAITPRRKNGLVGSVDWVTEAGARGRVSQLLESRTKESSKMDKLLENATIVDLKEDRKDLVESIVKEATADKDTKITKLEADLKEANGKISKIEDQGKLDAQKATVETQLKESKAPDAVKDRVKEHFSSSLVEGDLKEAVTNQLASELEYASKLSGKSKIKLGEGENVDVKESAQKEINEAFGVKEEKKDDKDAE